MTQDQHWPKKATAYAEFIDVNDHDAVLRWAREICRDISVDEAARLLHTEPTLQAVVDVLTSSLPDSSRTEAAKICEAELLKGSSEKL